MPAAYDGGPGMRYDGHGTGWNTLAAKATWRPSGRQGTHVVRMMEAVAGKGIGLKTPYQFFILHDLKPRNSKLETRNS